MLACLEYGAVFFAGHLFAVLTSTKAALTFASIALVTGRNVAGLAVAVSACFSASVWCAYTSGSGLSVWQVASPLAQNASHVLSY
jgi:uncharacterized membrane protein YedE/YeeE